MLVLRILINVQSGGDTVARRGYWGDMISSPYLSFGISTRHKELLTKEGGRHTKVSSSIYVATLTYHEGR